MKRVLFKQSHVGAGASVAYQYIDHLLVGLEGLGSTSAVDHCCNLDRLDRGLGVALVAGHAEC